MEVPCSSLAGQALPNLLSMTCGLSQVRGFIAAMDKRRYRDL